MVNWDEVPRDESNDSPRYVYLGLWIRGVIIEYLLCNTYNNVFTMRKLQCYGMLLAHRYVMPWTWSA